MSNETTLDDVLALVEVWRADALLLGESNGYGLQLDRAAEELEALLPAIKAALEDARRLDWLEAQQGSNLVSDDDCRWAVSDSGFQPVPEEGGFTEDVAITAFVEPETWAPTIRAAIDAAQEAGR